MSAAHAQHVGLLVRTGHAAHNLAPLRRIALTLPQHESTARCGIEANRPKAGWDHRSSLQVLASSLRCDCPGSCLTPQPPSRFGKGVGG
jgi:hypothetical protein